jgi:TonB family protein
MVQTPVTTLLVGALGLTGALGCVGARNPEPVPIMRVEQLDEVPILRDFPELVLADGARTPIAVQCVLDTSGRIVKDMILNLDGPSNDLSAPVTKILLQASFSRPLVHGEPRRALVEVAFDLNSRTAVISPRLSDRIAWLESMVEVKPAVLSGPPLHYPDEARQAGITGRVIVQAVIGRDGRAEPASVRIIQSLKPDIDYEATHYVYNATFRPAQVAGRPVRTLVTIPIDFKIRRSSRTVGP